MPSEQQTTEAAWCSTPGCPRTTAGCPRCGTGAYAPAQQPTPADVCQATQTPCLRPDKCPGFGCERRFRDAGVLPPWKKVVENDT
jgi:hypothetical protein